MGEKFYITTAIAYTSRKPHIGNTYEIVLTDAIARFKKQQGFDVYFLTGTDEHGIKIQEIAESAGISPKEYVDGVAGEIKAIWDLMNTSYDKFIRTTDEYHVKQVQKIFKKFYDQGDIYKGEYEGMYCVPCETFYTESQLVDGKCPDCGREVKPAKEEAYFFKMSKYQDKLMEYIEQNPDFIQPESRKREMINNFLKPGLQDLCVSRTSFTWGVPVEFDPGHVIYVWIDALSNYITALGYDDENPSELFKKNWPADVHVIGKDILRFHTIYWPIMLMALGLPLPKKVFGHPWLLFGNDKMSKSKGNVIYADDLVELFGVDAVRFYLLSEMPYANDGSITYENIIARYNSELANVLGNLVNRTVAMTHKYFDGVVKEPSEKEAVDDELISQAKETVKNAIAKMEEYKTSDAIEQIWNLLKRSNKYIDETTPWNLAKDESKSKRLGTVLYNLIEAIRIAAVLLTPFMPETAEKIANQINAGDLSFDSIKEFGGYKAGTQTNEAVPLFARLDEEKTLEKIEKFLEKYNESEEKFEPFKEEIEFEDFEKCDLRVAKVLECEEVPKANKLLKFKLKVGNEERIILSGIKKYYKPEDLVGKNVLIIANLKPRKIMGIESKGMILSAVDDNEDLLSVTTTLDGQFKAGTIVC
ncbi:MAG: methionine--tRNA ligase [Clostridia bacterium]|nr:methionine--tRNA ligase [Clostridia bacterium]